MDSGNDVGHHYAGPTGSTRTAAPSLSQDRRSDRRHSVDPWLPTDREDHNAIDGRMSDITTIQRPRPTVVSRPQARVRPASARMYTATYFYRTHVGGNSND
jgi:hypothetical protein